MRVVIIGAGHDGYYLAERLIAEGQDVVVIEADEAKAAAIQDRLDCLVIHGNGASPSALRKAGADRAGLVHSTNNAQHDVTYICNCCTCSCGVLRGIVDYGKQNSVASSDFFVQVDADLCNGCEACIDRCQFDALKMEEGISKVDIDACYGCGLCVTSCAVEALSMIQKNESHRQVPPVDDKAWRIVREENRTQMNT